MKKCSSCGAMLNDEDRFCLNCGTKYEAPSGKFCPACGAKAERDANFCMECGARFSPLKETGNIPGGVQAAPVSPAEPRPVAEPPRQPARSGVGRQAAAAMSSGAVYTENHSAYAVPERVSTSVDHVEMAPEKQEWYLIQFFRSLFQSHNTSVTVYLGLNWLIITGIFIVMFSELNAFAGLLLALITYGGSLCIALSPLGEMLLRWQTGCRKITRPEIIAKIEPLFNEAKARAVRAAACEGVSIPQDIQLFINNDEAPNAFATGRKTICFTKGLLKLPEDQIIATLTHEFGHIAHHDTDIILVVTVGNLIVTSFITFMRVCVIIFNTIMGLASACMGGTEGAIGVLLSNLSSMLSLMMVDGFMWLWTKFGEILVMHSMRNQEYRADEFAFNCGYGNPLCALLDSFTAMYGDSKASGLFATLQSTHPENDDRVGALQNLGATYRSTI